MRARYAGNSIATYAHIAHYDYLKGWSKNTAIMTPRLYIGYSRTDLGSVMLSLSKVRQSSSLNTLQPAVFVDRAGILGSKLPFAVMGTAFHLAYPVALTIKFRVCKQVTSSNGVKSHPNPKRKRWNG
jgi:hypothetical protein